MRDQTGAVVPSALLTLTNTDTGVVAKTSVNEAGLYVFPGLPPGPYSVSAEAAGMATFQGLVTIHVQERAVIDIVLKVAAVAVALEVQDVTPMLTVDRPTLGRVVERQRIDQLPLNGRQLTSLLDTVPGMEGVLAYGLRNNSTDYLLDGAPLIDPLKTSVPRRQPGLDSVEEFRVENSNSSAKFSKPASIIVSTKSGTNEFHGSLFETHRNNAIGRARTREDFSGTAPQLIRNEFGASASGPVLLPRLYDGRNRTFWFAAYEGLRSVSATVKGASVPTEAMRNGDFRGLVDSQGRQYNIYDPWSTNPATWERQQVSYQGQLNVIDPGLMSPLAKYLYSITPAPTHPEVNPLVDYNWWGPWPERQREWTVTTRADHNFSDHDRFFARFTKGGYRNWKIASNMPMLDSVPNSQDTISPNWSMSTSWVRVFSPTFFNELLVTGSRGVWWKGTGEPGRHYSDELGVPNPFGTSGWPRLGTTGLTGYGFENVNTESSPFFYGILEDNLTKLAGKHELQFGGRFRYDQSNAGVALQYKQGYVQWDTRATALYDPKSSRSSPNSLPFTGHDTANFFLGVARYNARFQPERFYLRSREYALYFQDNLRVNSRLTLNLGLRWEYWPPYQEKRGLLTGFDPQKRAIVLREDLDALYQFQATLPSIVRAWEGLGAKFISYQDAGMPATLFTTPKTNFGPRLGLAYRAGEGWNSLVLRAGYRISYHNMPQDVFMARMRSNTPLNADFSYNPGDAASSPDGIRYWYMRSAPVFIAGKNSQNAISVETAQGLTRGSLRMDYFADEQPLMQIQDWNLTIEKELKTGTVFRASYVGQHAGNLEQSYTYNEATPTYIWLATRGERLPTGEYSGVARRPYDQQVYGNLWEIRRTGWMNFNGVQFELERRHSKGIAYQVFYNLGNTLLAGGNSYNSTVADVNQFLPGAVPQDYDERNRFLNYQRNADVPKHRVRWNFLVDLPFGKGKWLGRNAAGFLDRIIGGWQIAGMGSLRSNYFSLPLSVYPNGNKIELYGYKYPIEDCRSGVCYPGYLWWNGYIPANKINSHDPVTGKPNGVMGVPAAYKPAGEPLIPWPANPSPSDPLYSYYGSNTVWVPMKDGTLERTTYDDGLHPWRQQYLPSVRQWGLTASLYKRIPVTERVALRFNADFFNVLNHPGNPNSVGGDGILSTRTSGQGARVVQLSLRLSW